MGATTFGNSGRNGELDAAKAFTELVEQARYAYGHSGYTGTIAEKSKFTVIEEKPLSIDAAVALSEKLLGAGDPRVDDKWGPAGAIRVNDHGDGEANNKARRSPYDGWYFFGWASDMEQIRKVPVNPFKDYSSMEIPRWVKGFHDRSWHNDAGAFMVREFQPKKPGYRGMTVRLFFADPEDHGNWLCCQYGLFITGVDEETHEKDATIYWGNDEQEMILATNLLVKALELLYD